MQNHTNTQTTFSNELLQLIKGDRHGSEVISILMSKSNLQQQIDHSGKTLLHYAAEYGNDNVVKHLADSGVDVDRQDCDGRTPIMLTSKSTTIDFLLDRNANIYIEDNNGKCAINRLLEANYNGTFFEKFSSEHQSDAEMSLKLLHYDCTIYTAIKFRRPEVTLALLKRGCKFVPSNSPLRHVDALILAVNLLDIENVRVLLDFGVDVNTEGFRGATPMSCRSICYSNDNRRLQILRLLLERGANPTKIISSKTLTRTGEMQMAPILKFGKKATIRVLLEFDVDLNARDENGQTAIHYVIFNESPGVYQEFKGKQYNVNISDNDGSTPFHHISAINFDAAKFLHASGACMNARDRKGMTILMTVWQNNDYCRVNVSYSTMSAFFNKTQIQQSEQLINYLLYHGADPQAVVPEQQHSIFCDVSDMIKDYWLTGILSHLAILEARGVPIVEVIAKQIDDNVYLRDYFRDCKLSLEKTKEVKIWRSLTLYHLLVDNEEMMERHVRNEKFQMFLYRTKNNNMSQMGGTYCMYVMRMRLLKAIKVMKLRQKTVVDLSKALNLCQLVAEKIASYIGESDLQNLYASINE